MVPGLVAGATLKGEGAGETLAGTTLTRATLAGQPWRGRPGGQRGGKPVKLARATLRRAMLKSWKGILGATGRATTWQPW